MNPVVIASTASASATAYPRVRIRECVPVLTVGLPRLRIAAATSHVLQMRDRLHVVSVYTRALSAQVVNLHPGRNLPMPLRIGEPVGQHCCPRSHGKASVPVVIAAP